MALLYTDLGALCGAFTCGDGTTAGDATDAYILPATLTLQSDDADLRFREEQRVWQHGSVPYGEEWDARDIVLAGTVWEDSTAEMQALLRALRQKAARPDQRLRIDTGTYINVSRLRRMDARPVDLTGRSLMDVRLVWRATDPFWYSETQASHVEELSGSDSFTVDTGSTATVDMYPVISITAPSGGSVSSLTLSNETDDDQAFGYDDAGLTDGASVVIDSGAGTVSRGGTNTIRYYSGGWLRLKPGENTLAYTGNACTITLTWHTRWI